MSLDDQIERVAEELRNIMYPVAARESPWDKLPERYKQHWRITATRIIACL